MVIDNSGFWNGDNIQDLHYYDKSVGSFLVNFCVLNKINTIVDFGCGKGDYIKELLLNSFDACGYDGNPNTYVLTNGLASNLELHKNIKGSLNNKFDLVISFEVGEHIPSEFEDIFIENIIYHCNKYLIMSWAIPGQGGYGHVNERDNHYIIEKINKQGFKFLKEQTDEIRECSELFWFKQSLMIFKRK